MSAQTAIGDRRFSSRFHSGVLGEVRGQAAEYTKLSNSELVEEARQLREQIEYSSKPTIELRQLVALGSAAVRKVFGFELHDVQIRAVFLGACGTSVQMQTGEGKTIVSALIAFVRSHFEPVHLATTNSYLAKRDFEETQAIFESVGCSVGLIDHDQNKQAKRNAYRMNVVYGPGYQFGFDYLSDQLTLRDACTDKLGMETMFAINGLDIEGMLLQPGDFGTMIIDEADSVMIDEAMTPLILSGSAGDHEDKRPYQLAKCIADKLVEGEGFQIDELTKKIELNSLAQEQVFCELKNQKGKFHLIRPWQNYVINAIHALRLLCRNEHYVVVDEKVKIVDQFTGRIFDDRQWQAGLHQAVEAKEGGEINSGNQVLAQITRQRYFLKYNTLIGLSGTTAELADELKSVYSMKITSIPTNKPCQRIHLRTRFFATMEAKLKAIAADVAKHHAQGQPILIGTRTIEQSLQMKDALDFAGVPAVLLNGIQDEEEAEIVAQAGRHGMVTISTNMAGRGTDIKLTDQARQAGGLYVIGVEHNFSTRIDRQLVGRCARQGDVGKSRFFVSAEDELIAAKHPGVAERMIRYAGKDGEIRRDFSKTIRRLQGREEQESRRQRVQMNLHGNWLNAVRKTLSDGKV